MDLAASLDRIGREVALIVQPSVAGHPPVGTRGFVTGVAASRVPNPVQVTFDDIAHTIRYYSETQFAAHFAVLA